MFLSFSQMAHAVVLEDDSVSHLAKKRANRAALYSAVLPGAGQVFNKKYWNKVRRDKKLMAGTRRVEYAPEAE